MVVSKDTFEKVVSIVNDKSIQPEKPASQSQKLRFYGLYKQATIGNLKEPNVAEEPSHNDQRPKARPGIFDITGRLKYDAWDALSGKSKQDAMDEYVELASEVIGQPVKDLL